MQNIQLCFQATACSVCRKDIWNPSRKYEEWFVPSSFFLHQGIFHQVCLLCISMCMIAICGKIFIFFLSFFKQKNGNRSWLVAWICLLHLCLVDNVSAVSHYAYSTYILFYDFRSTKQETITAKQLVHGSTLLNALIDISRF